jgi:hypothetical protein
MTPRDAASIVWSVATMHQLHKQQLGTHQDLHMPLLLPLQQLQVLLSHVLGHVGNTGPQEVVNSLWAAAKLEPCVLPGGLLSQQVLQHIADKAVLMSLQVSVWACQLLGPFNRSSTSEACTQTQHVYLSTYVCRRVCMCPTVCLWECFSAPKLMLRPCHFVLLCCRVWPTLHMQ